jgi:hypothetical protein
MKKLFLVISICTGLLILTSPYSQAARTCFCDVNGCCTGDGFSVPKGTCDSINGRPNDNVVNPEDRISYGQLWEGTGERPPWLDFYNRSWVLESNGEFFHLDVPEQKNYLQLLLAKQDKELDKLKADLEVITDEVIDIKEKMNDLNSESYEKQISDLQNKKDDAQDRLSNSDQKKLTDAEKKLDRANKELADNESRLKSDIEARNKEIEDLNQEYEKRIKEGGYRKELYDVEKKSLANLDLSKKENRDLLKTMTEDLLPKEVEALKNKAKQLEKDNKNDKEKMTELKKDAEWAKLDVESVKSENVQAKIDLEQAQKKLNRLKNLPDSEKQKINDEVKKRQALKDKGEKLVHKQVKLHEDKMDLIDSNDELRRALDASKNKGKQHQVKSNDAPDADRYFGLKDISFSTGVSGSSFKDDRAASGSKGGSKAIDLGVDIRLSQRFSISPGVSFGKSDIDDDSGGGSDTDSINGQIGFFWGPFRTPDAWFDGNISYSASEIATDAVGSAGQLLKKIKYDSKNTGIGIGINRLKQLGLRTQLEGRLGWSAAFGNREAYTDSSNIIHPETDTTIHRFSFGCRLARQMDWGRISLSGSLKYVGSDNSSADQDDKPLDANIGLGAAYNITDNCSLSGNIGSAIGRDDYQEYNSSVSLKFNF